MQRHTLTFRSKKKTKRTKILISYLVFVFFDIFVYFRDQNIGFRIFGIQKHSRFSESLRIVPLLHWNSAYFEHQQCHFCHAR